MSALTYDVPDISCGHSEAAISTELRALPGVETVEVDLAAKRVAVSGGNLDDAAIRAAIYEAGYEAVAA